MNMEAMMFLHSYDAGQKQRGGSGHSPKQIPPSLFPAKGGVELSSEASRARYGASSGRHPVALLLAIALHLALAVLILVKWGIAPDIVKTTPPMVVTFQPLAAPPEPAHDVPEGPQQVEQKAQKAEKKERTPELLSPPLLTPDTIVMQPPAQPVIAQKAIKETTAPKSTPAPPAPQMASNSPQSWEAEVLARLEQYRRYPAAARARREQGVAYVRFRMNRAGKVLWARLIRSSGSALLDREALSTVRRAQPLPSIPVNQSDELELTVPIEFYIGSN